MRGKVNEDVIRALEATAAEEDAWVEIATALQEALVNHELRPEVLQLLERTVAIWFRDYVEDLDAAEAAATRAVAAGPNKLEVLTVLASLQRRNWTKPSVMNWHL